MTDLSDVPTDTLRHELFKRTKREEDAEREAFRLAYPCPECGADPRELDRSAIEEFRSAPRDSDGRPMLYADYGDTRGTTNGLRWRTTLTCVNGHVTDTTEIEWRKDAKPGPPVLATTREP